MKKHTSEDAQAARMRSLAGVNQTSVNESKNHGLGTLIDFERAADGVAYGIIKEQRKYYIKKGGLNENVSHKKVNQSVIEDYERKNLITPRVNEMLIKHKIIDQKSEII